MVAAYASAVTGPMLGVLIKSRHAGAAWARAATAWSSRLISRFKASTQDNSGSNVACKSGRASKAVRTRPASLPAALGKRSPKDPRRPRIVFSVARRWRTR